MSIRTYRSSGMIIWCALLASNIDDGGSQPTPPPTPSRMRWSRRGRDIQSTPEIWLEPRTIGTERKSFSAHFAKSSRAHSSSFLVERPHVISSPISDVVCHLAVKGWIIKLTNSMFWRGHPSHSQNMTHKFIYFRGTYQSAHECARSPAPAKLNGSLPKRDIFLNLCAKAGH